MAAGRRGCIGAVSDISGSAGRRRRPDFVEDAIDDGVSGDGVRSDGAVDGGAVRRDAALSLVGAVGGHFKFAAGRQGYIGTVSDSIGSAGRRRRPDFVEDAIDDGVSGEGVRSNGAVDGGAVRNVDAVVMLMKPL